MDFPKKILIVDDDPSVTHVLESQLQAYGVNLAKAHDLDSALYFFNTQRYDLVIVELEFDPLPGLALIQKWRKHEIEEKRLTPFIVTSGMKRNQGDELLLQELGNLEFLLKPFNARQLHALTLKVVEQRRINEKFEEVKKTASKLMQTSKDPDKAINYVIKNVDSLGIKGKKILGDMYETVERYEEGLRTVDGVLAESPKDISMLNSKGRMLLKLGKYEEAAQHMEKADELAPDNIERVNQLAMLYLKMNEPAMSVKKMKNLLDLNPEKSDLKFELFAKLHEHGFDKEAQAFCQETTGPQEVVRHYNNKGVSLSKIGKTEAALTEYERALGYYPNFKDNYKILYNIALARLAQKNVEALKLAEEALTKCIALEPNFEKAKKTLEAVRENLTKIKNSMNSSAAK